MHYNTVNIAGFGYEIPPIVVSSDDIEAELKPTYERLHLPAGRLELISGIKTRHLWNPDTLPSKGAILAGEKAIASAGIPREKLGCLIMCSVCRDFLEPATATLIHNKLGLSSNAHVFDISNACLGVLTGMLIVANMIQLNQIEAGLLVASENSRSLIETTIKKINNDKTLTRQTIKPYFASLTIGSGAVAVVMSNRQLHAENHRFIGGTTLAVTCHNKLCRGNKDKGMIDSAETLMDTDSETLMYRGIEVANENWNSFKKEIGWAPDSIDRFCTHQVGKAHKKLLFDTLGINIEKDFSTLEYLGNAGSVSCPITTAIAIEKNFISPAQKIALLGIGSGINCTMLGLEW